MSRKLETLESIKYYNWLKANSLIFPILKLIIHVPNEGKRSNRAGQELKAMGMLPGVADYVCLVGGKIPGYDSILQPFAIEMKANDGRQSAKQKMFELVYSDFGGKYYLCRSAEEAVTATKEHLKPWMTMPIGSQI